VDEERWHMLKRERGEGREKEGKGGCELQTVAGEEEMGRWEGKVDEGGGEEEEVKVDEGGGDKEETKVDEGRGEEVKVDEGGGKEKEVKVDKGGGGQRGATCWGV